jgi:hypothetical protein
MEIFSSPPLCPDKFWGPTASYIIVTGVISPGLKRPGREADYTIPSSGEIKNTWSHSSIAPYVFMA